jgi:hypothetical protein
MNPNLIRLIEENGLTLHGDIEYFALLVAEEEGEKIASMVEQMGIEGYGTLAIAAAIRARGEK